MVYNSASHSFCLASLLSTQSPCRRWLKGPPEGLFKAKLVALWSTAVTSSLSPFPGLLQWWGCRVRRNLQHWDGVDICGENSCPSFHVPQEYLYFLRKIRWKLIPSQHELLRSTDNTLCAFAPSSQCWFSFLACSHKYCLLRALFPWGADCVLCWQPVSAVQCGGSCLGKCERHFSLSV